MGYNHLTQMSQTQCDTPIEKVDIFKEDQGKGTSQGKIIPIKRHFTSLIFVILF